MMLLPLLFKQLPDGLRFCLYSLSANRVVDWFGSDQIANTEPYIDSYSDKDLMFALASFARPYALHEQPAGISCLAMSVSNADAVWCDENRVLSDLSSIPEPTAVARSRSGCDLYWVSRDFVRFGDELKYHEFLEMQGRFKQKVMIDLSRSGWRVRQHVSEHPMLMPVPGTGAEHVELLSANGMMHGLSELFDWDHLSPETRKAVKPPARATPAKAVTKWRASSVDSQLREFNEKFNTRVKSVDIYTGVVAEYVFVVHDFFTETLRTITLNQRQVRRQEDFRDAVMPYTFEMGSSSRANEWDKKWLSILNLVATRHAMDEEDSEVDQFKAELERYIGSQEIFKESAHGRDHQDIPPFESNDGSSIAIHTPSFMRWIHANNHRSRIDQRQLIRVLKMIDARRKTFRTPDKQYTVWFIRVDSLVSET